MCFGDDSSESEQDSVDRSMTKRSDCNKCVDRIKSPNKIIQLYNKNGYNLCIYPDGNVSGTREPYNPYAKLEVLTADRGEVIFRGVETDLFLSMNSSGKLEGVADANHENVIFIQIVHGPYLAYRSRRYAYQGWHIALKKNGKVKPGRDTWHPFRQKAILFLHRPGMKKDLPRRYLVNSYGFRLSLLPTQEIQGTKDDLNSKYSVLEISPGPFPDTIRFEGVETNKYLAISSTGRVYSESNLENHDTLFVEHKNQLGHTIIMPFRSAHLGWKLGLTKSGHIKSVFKTVIPANQKATSWSYQPVRADTDLSDTFAHILGAG